MKLRVSGDLEFLERLAEKLILIWFGVGRLSDQKGPSNGRSWWALRLDRHPYKAFNCMV